MALDCRRRTMTLLLIILCGYLDRMRGSDYTVLPSLKWDGEEIGNSEWKILYGWVVAALFGHAFSWLTIPIIILFAIGEAWGWGEPLGSALQGRKMNQDNLEKWQFGPLKKDPWLALAFRGLMWGAPVALLLSWFDPILMSLPFLLMLSMPVACLIAKQLSGTTSEKWAYQELIRGLLLGLLITGVMTNG